MATRFTMTFESEKLNRDEILQRIGKVLAGQGVAAEVVGGGVRRSGGGGKVTPELEKQVVSAKQGGSTYAEISETFDISTAVVNKILHKNGLTKKVERRVLGSKGAKVTFNADGSVSLTEATKDDDESDDDDTDESDAPATAGAGLLDA